MVAALEVSAFSVVLNDGDFTMYIVVGAAIFSLLFVVPAAVLRRWYFYRRRLKGNVITAEYAPPLGFNPAEIGYMFDGKLGEREVGGTILHLISRGYLHVKEVDQSKRIFAGPRVGDDLKVYEKKLIEQADMPDGVRLDDLLHRFIPIKVADQTVLHGSKPFVFTQMVHNDLERNHYVRPSSWRRFFAVSLKLAILLSITLVFIPIIGLWFLTVLDSGVTDFLALAGLMLMAVIFTVVSALPLFAAGMFLSYIRGRIIGREWIITPKLERLWPQIAGYRQYIKMVEEDRLEFLSQRLAESSKNDALPYAVALGFVKNWRDMIS